MDKDKTTPQKNPAPQSLESNEGANQAQTTAQDPQSSKKEGPAQQPADKSPVKKLLNFSRLYLVAFFLLIIIAAMVVLVLTQKSKKSGSSNNKTASLTSGQLSQIQGNTTLVGDAKQTLDIQGSAIFEGQGLFRSDLAVASALKVGGAISGQSLNIGGVGNFNQLQVNQTLSVNGDFSVNGQLTIQKSLSVTGNGSFNGTLTTSELTAGSIQLNGDFSFSHHIVTNGSVPGITNGPALGVGGTASVSGADTAGSIALNIGSSPAAGILATVNFSSKFAKTPHIVVTPVGASAAGLQYYITRTTGGFSLATASAPTAGSSFGFDYIVID